MGIALEGGYHITPDLRVRLGYVFCSAEDRDSTGFRSSGGILVYDVAGNLNLGGATVNVSGRGFRGGGMVLL